MNNLKKCLNHEKTETKNGVVPKLRFPEFRGGAGWESINLGQISEIVRGGSPRPIEVFITTDDDGLNWLKIADVDKESKYVTYTKEKVIPSALSKTREVNPGDLIMSNSMSFGRPYILKIQSCIHDGWIAVTQIKQQASRDFLYYLILAPKSQEYFVDNAAGSGVQNLNADIIKLLPVQLPPLPEQSRIADCLSSLDSLIAAHSQKLDGLKSYKKGLMQQLFPAKGEKVPKLRFPEFRKSGEWEMNMLGNRAQFFSGYPFKSEEITDNSSGISLMRGINITEGYIRHNAEIDRYYCGNPKPLEKYKVQVNDLVIGMDGSKVGKNSALITERDAGALLVQRVARLRAEKTSTIAFIFQHINSIMFHAYVDKINTSSGIPHISAQQINEFIIFFPPSEKEQQRIASFLTSIDNLITAQSQKIESLKIHKKGLMQQLFPAMEEAIA